MARKAATSSLHPPKPAASRWTDDQWAGIATTGRSVLVSAAAGSGKTAVLAERCAFLVCDAKPPCDVDELLVVTFTEAAAAEMKSRIERALHDRLAKSSGEDRRLARQLALIDRAQVSTLHGFCAKLIRQHFHLLGLDPAFTVIDGDEAALLRLEVSRQLFAEQYESPAAEKFHALVDAYADGNDERLISKLVHTYEMLRSLVNPREWIEKARQRIAEATKKPLEETALGKELIDDVRRRLAELSKTCDSSLAAVSAMDGFGKYVTDLQSCRQVVRHWCEVLEKDGLDALAEESDVQLPKLPSIAASTPGKETAKALVDLVRDQIKSGPLRKTLAFSTAQWVDGLKRIRPHAELFLELVEKFGERYRTEKDALRGVDFNDLERLALRALREPKTETLAPSNVAKMLHKQFAHVLVDEYQDINEVQDAILRLASRECLETADGAVANLFCVGDVKQSIYGFRLAEPSRFLRRRESFLASDASGKLIDLQANFRSRAPLLDVLNRVFSRLMSKDAADLDYDKTHELRAGLEFLDPRAGGGNCFKGAPVELHLLPADLDSGAVDSAATEDVEPDRAGREAMLVAKLIRQMTGDDGASKPMCVIDKTPSGTLEPRPIRYGDIVVLLRSMRYKGDDYADVLRASGIPVHSESGSGYFESMEVRDMLALLQVLDNRRQDIPLAAVLRSPIASVPEPEDALARIRLEYPKHVCPFHEAVVRYADEQHDELAAKLKDVLHRLDRWRLMAQRRPLAELIWDVYDSTGYLAFCTGLRDGEQRKANLIDLHERARQFGTFQRQGLARFLAFLDRLQEESDLGQPSIAGEGENVVRIMTIHRSKGLEFPVVILPDLGKAINLRDCAGSILVDRRAYLGMDVVDEAKQVRYPSLASMLVANRLRQQALAEELRVLYVATTRAKEHLVLVGTAKEGAADAWEARWKNHDGPLPAADVLGARSMLDWLGPVASLLKRDDEEPIQIIPHTSEEVARWQPPDAAREADGERQQRLAKLIALSPAPSSDAAADEIIARLTTPYPFEVMTKIAAVGSATVLTKQGRAAPRGWETSQKTDLEFTPTLELPRAVRTDTKPTAADVGSATHVLLNHLDFARKCDVDDLRGQLQSLIEKRLIAAAEAAHVDLDSICWLVGSDVGQLIRKHGKSVRRELPVYLAVPARDFDPAAPASDDPEDRVMVRSRIDVLLPAGDHAGEWEIVDYKTDRLDSAAAVDERAGYYRPQMEMYRRAAKAITGREVAKVHLVFLSAKAIRTL